MVVEKFYDQKGDWGDDEDVEVERTLFITRVNIKNTSTR